jgi:hypothetical protein
MSDWLGKALETGGGGKWHKRTHLGCVEILYIILVSRVASTPRLGTSNFKGLVNETDLLDRLFLFFRSNLQPPSIRMEGCH